MTKFFDHMTGDRRELNFDFGRAMRLRFEAELLATPVPHVGDDWTHATTGDNAPEPELPEGVSMRKGRFFADCCCCQRECDVTEFMDEAADINFEEWYGGCGPRCCP